MGTILQGGTVVELEPASVEVTDLRVEGSLIVQRGEVGRQEGDELVDARGKVVMPGLVCAHHHLYASLVRGRLAASGLARGGESRWQEAWWRLQGALDLDAVELSATVGGLEALRCGTTTIFDHHGSSSHVAGSLTRVAAGLNGVGVRGVLAYDVSDRLGGARREAALEETASFIAKARGRFRGLVGAQASFALSGEGLAALSEATQAANAGLHIHLAEDMADERLSVDRYGEAPVKRLLDRGLLNPRSLVASAVALSWPELSQVIGTGAWLVHNARANMDAQLGYAPAGKFGARATLGTDALSADLFAEGQAAYLRAREAGQGIDLLRYLANGHRLASQVFDLSIGPMRAGAVADLLLLDYDPLTPMDADNLASHLLYGMSARAVEAVMVDGIWRMWARRPLSIDLGTIHPQARETAAALGRALDAL